MGNAWWAENFSVGRSSLQKMISDGSGLLALSGVGSSQLKKFLSDGFGWEDPSGSAASILKKLISDGSGSQLDNGIAASIMKQLLSDGSGNLSDSVSGIGSSSFLKLISNGSGSQLDSGIGASSLKKLISNGSGSQIIPLSYGSSGTGAATNGAPNFTINIPSDANAITVYCSQSWFSALGAPTCTVGGVSATLSPASILNGGGANGDYSLYAWTLKNPPTGTSVAVNIAGTSGYCSSEGMSYKNVNTFGTHVSANGTGATASVTASSATGQMVSNGFACSAGSITSYNQTQRFLVNTASFVNYGLVTGDAPGASSVNFQAGQNSAAAWMGIAIPMLP